MRDGDSNLCTKRISPRITLGAEPPSELVNTEIDDLPDVVLVEILCRFSCYKFIFECKCVSKHWCTLMSSPYFIGRFLCLQSDHKQTPIIRTLINIKEEDFLTRMSLLTKALSLLFERLMSFHYLKRELEVVDTCNDLVLCCATKEHDYYICNPCTN